jgi:hypothetical protein
LSDPVISVRWSTADWHLVPGAADDELIERLVAEGDLEREAAFAAVSRRGRSAAPIAASLDCQAGEAFVFAVRHASGAITFHLARREERWREGRRSQLRLHFELPMRSDPTRAGIAGRARIFLLRVTGRFASATMAALARRWETRRWRSSGLHEGLVRVDRERLTAGKPYGMMSQQALAALRGERILLLIHGTFSDAESAFLPFSSPIPGGRRSLLDEGGDRYAAVLAFNHRTVSLDPMENARALLAELPRDAVYDVVSHSRGGLLFRALNELLPPEGNSSPINFEKVILAAAPNCGTPLAAPVRLLSLLEWLINLTEMVPGHGLSTAVSFVAHALSWLARGVPGALPGIAPMVPGSDLATALAASPGERERYFSLVANHRPAPRWKSRLLDLGVDRLFGCANDLVVPTEGGWQTANEAGRWIGPERIACLGEGGNLSTDDSVHHLNLLANREAQRFILDTLAGRASLPWQIDTASFLPWGGGPLRRGGEEFASSAAAAVIEPLPDRPLPPAPAARDRFHLTFLGSRGEEKIRVVGQFADALVTEVISTRGGEAGRSMRQVIAMHERLRAIMTGRSAEELPKEEELIEYGSLLFSILFPGEVRRLFESALSVSRPHRFDLVFTSNVDWLADKPWEFARDPLRGSWLASEAVNFVRAIPSPMLQPESQPLATPLRIVVAVAQPISLSPVSAAEEERLIRRGFARLLDAGLAVIEVLHASTPAALHRRLAEGNCDVVHFIGHGEFDERRGEGVLYFEDDGGEQHRVGARILREMFANRGVRLVILNACETGRGGRHDFSRGVAPALLAAGIPAVLANQYPVIDSAATSFVRHFYWSVAQGMRVADAAREARVGVGYELGGTTIDWAVPVLYARSAGERLVEVPLTAEALPPASAAALKSRRGSRGSLRIGLADLNNCFPSLEKFAAVLNGAQRTFRFEAVEMPLPIGSWRRGDDGALELDGEEVLRRAPADPGLDLLLALTSIPLREGASGLGAVRLLQVSGRAPEELLEYLIESIGTLPAGADRIPVSRSRDNAREASLRRLATVRERLAALL